MPHVRVDWNGLAADVAPPDDTRRIVRDELRVAKTQVARDERCRFIDRKAIDERKERPLAHDGVRDIAELLDVGERDGADDGVGHLPRAISAPPSTRT